LRFISVHADHTTYFDTPDLALHRAGSRCASAIAHGNSYVQNVKAPAPAGSRFRRQEWEWPVAGEPAGVRMLSGVPGLPPLLAGSEARLRPVFRTRSRAPSISCRRPPAPRSNSRSTMHSRVQRRSEPLSELEIELKRGPEEVLYRLGSTCCMPPHCRAVESKASVAIGCMTVRGRGGQGPTDRARPGHPPVRCFPPDRRFSARHLLANQPAALHGEEDEGIHQMRVAVRRLRSLLALFQPFLEPHTAGRFADELRRLGQVLGTARDWTSSLPDPATGDRGRRGARLARTAALSRARASARRPSGCQKGGARAAFSRFVLAFQAFSRCGDAVLAHRLIERPFRAVAPDLLDRWLARPVAVSRKAATMSRHACMSCARARRSCATRSNFLPGSTQRQPLHDALRCAAESGWAS